MAARHHPAGLGQPPCACSGDGLAGRPPAQRVPATGRTTVCSLGRDTPRVSTAERVIFDHVTKRYPGTGTGNPGAVEDLSLEVPAGKVCVLVGP